MPWFDPRLLPGAWIYVPDRGALINGKLDDDAADRLRREGVLVQEHTWVEPISSDDWFERASDEDKRDRIAADIMLGRMPNAEGVTRTENDIAARMAKELEPMRKATHVAKMKRARMRRW